MTKIFISYRRDESSDVTGRMYDRLVSSFGAQNVFKDVDSIPLGIDFRKRLQDAVERCDVCLVVIGKQWLDLSNENGQRRLNDENDFVRIEIEAALQRNILIIPVLVQGTTIPSSDKLPSTICNLAFRNGMNVRPDPDFHRDMDRLIRDLTQLGRRDNAEQTLDSVGNSKNHLMQPSPSESAPVSGRLEEEFLSMEGSAVLYVASGPNQGQRFKLSQERTTIGRSGKCDIVLKSSFASSFHTLLIRQDEGFFIEDMGSKNGSFLNGKRIEGRSPLQDGDRILIGNVALVFRSPQ